jgi:D-3-phosphoglycerate dehydrogenase
MTYLVLVPDNLEASGLELLKATEGIELYAPGKMTREQTIEMLPQATAMIVRSDTKADADLLAHAQNLKVIVRAGVGVDNIDLNQCTEQGIVVMNAPDGNTVSTAEHTFAMMLALARHIPQADASMRAGKWDRKKFMGAQLSGKVLGIIGFGRVGRALAERASCFGMKEVAYDPFVPEDVARHLGLSIVPRVEDVFSQADIISLHCLVNNETRGMINAENIAKMKDGVMIINVARGQLINNADLAEALKSGKVAGAAVDVYDVEPPAADNPLLGLPNVIYTPHLGASTCEAQEAVGTQAAEEVINALFKDRFDNVRNKAVFEKI